MRFGMNEFAKHMGDEGTEVAALVIFVVDFFFILPRW